MPRYRFVVLDPSTGQHKKGALDAATEGHARDRILQGGFQLQSIALDQPEASIEPLPEGDPPTPFVRPVHRRATGLGGLVHWAMHLIAISVGLTAIGVALLRNPLGAGLSKYDFTTPRGALESEIKIRMSKDIRALMELSSHVDGKRQKEQLETLQIRKEVEFGGKKILFITYKVDGVAKFGTQAVEKDAATGFWVLRPVSEYDVEKTDRELAAQMRRWEASGELSEGRR